jgi:hypothetical protein
MFYKAEAKQSKRYSIGHKKAPWQKNCMVFQRFLAMVYSVAFDV